MQTFLRSEIFRSTFWNFLGMAFSLISGVITARILAPEERGVLALALTISTLGYIISSGGTNVAIRVLQPNKTWASFKVYFRLSLILLLLNLVIVLSIAAYFVIGNEVALSENVIVLVALAAVTFIANQMTDVLNTVGRISGSALINTSGQIVTALCLLGIFLSYEEAALKVTLFCYLTGFIIRVFLVSVSIKKAHIPLGESTPGSTTKLFIHGLRFWGVNLGQTLTFRADQVLLAAFSNAFQLGIYAVAVTPAGLMQVVSNSIGQIIMRKAATGHLSLFLVMKAIAGSAGVTALYSTFVFIIAPAFIPFVFGSDYTEAVPVVRTLLIAEILLTPYSILVRLLLIL